MKQEKQITIKKTIDVVTTTDVILEKNYWRVKIKLERLGYKVEKL